MNTSSVRWKPLGMIAVVLAAIAVVIFLIVRAATPSGPAQNAADTSSTVTTVANGTPGGSSTASAPLTSSNGAQNIPPPPGSTITIHLLTPIANNTWTIGQANPIAWDNAADITGEIDLVNAVTKKFIGVILSETGVKQTSYPWNAEEVYLGRYSPDEVAVVPGVYSISIHFDGNGLGDLVSGPITITK